MSDRIGEQGSRLRASLLAVGLIALAGVFLAPANQTGYWSEDLYQSIMPRGGSVINDTSWLGQVAGHIKTTLTIGRFFPLTPALMTTVHYVFHGAWAYKTFIVATGVLDIFLFYLLASKLGGRRDYGGFAACLTIGLIQYRVAVDPSLGFSGQMQLLIAGLFLTLLTLQRHLETRHWGWLLASGLAYFSCTLLYETAYLLILLPLLLILRVPDSWTRRAWTALPYFASAGFCAFETFLIRWLYPSDAYWHKPSFDPNAVAMGLIHQISAGLPLSYFAFDPLGIFPGPGRGGLLGWLCEWRLAMVALPAFGLSFLCLRGRSMGQNRAETTAEIAPGGIAWDLQAGLGLILAVVPALVIAISPYHRSKVSPGVGWIPALIQYYGVGMLLSAGIWNAVQTMAGGGPKALWKCLAASALVGSLVGVTYRANLEVVQCFNAPLDSKLYRDSVALSGGTHDSSRRLLEAALRSGLLDDVPKYSVIQPAQEYPFWYDEKFGRYFYAAHTGQPFNMMPPWAGGSLAVPEGFRVRDVSLGADSGYVILSRGVRGPTAPVDQAPSTGFRLFVRHPELAKPSVDAPFRIEGRGTSTINGRELRAIKTGPGWAIYALDGLDSPVAPDSLRVEFGQPDPRAVAEGATRSNR